MGICRTSVSVGICRYLSVWSVFVFKNRGHMPPIKNNFFTGGVKQWCIIGQSDTTTDKKEVNKVIRVTDFNQTLALQATALGGTQG